MAKTKHPIKEFLHLTASARGLQISQQMEMLRIHCPSPDEWLVACVNRIAKNQQELLFICYMFGTYMGSVATQKNVGKRYLN